MEQENKVEENVEEVKKEKKANKFIAKTKKVFGKFVPVGSLIKSKIGKNGTMIAAVVLVAAVALSFGYKQYRQKIDVGPEAVKAIIVNLIKENNGSVKNVEEESGLYKVAINFGGKEQLVYVTKDGKKLVDGSVIGFDEIEKQREAARKQEEEDNREVPKTDKPTVDLYVMSFCPYGNKSEDTLKPVYDLLKNKVDFNFRYIVNVEGNEVQSLHGEPEATQNEREACVLRDYGKDKWFSFATYVNAKCGGDGKCWETGAKTLGLNVSKINACVEADGVSLMKADAEASNAANASGSPTMKINGVNSKAVYQYGKPDAYKKAICDAFNVAPAECSKVLPDQSTASASSSSAASCGQ